MLDSDKESICPVDLAALLTYMDHCDNSANNEQLFEVNCMILSYELMITKWIKWNK
jgi:hypothetical protein